MSSLQKTAVGLVGLIAIAALLVALVRSREPQTASAITTPVAIWSTPFCTATTAWLRGFASQIEEGNEGRIGIGTFERAARLSSTYSGDLTDTGSVEDPELVGQLVELQELLGQAVDQNQTAASDESSGGALDQDYEQSLDLGFRTHRLISSILDKRPMQRQSEMGPGACRTANSLVFGMPAPS